jgi:hypothetical protein
LGSGGSKKSNNLKKEMGDEHAKMKNISRDAKTDAKLNKQGSKKSNNLKKEMGDEHAKMKNVSRDAKTDTKLNKQGSNKSTTSSDRNITKQNTHIRIDLVKLKIDVNCILYIAEKYLTTFHPFLFVFLIIGVISWTRMRMRRFFGLYMATAIASYLFILYRLCMSYFANAGIYGYPSRRHLIPLVIPAIFCVGIGVYTTGSWVHEKFKFERLKNGLRGRLRNVWMVQLLILLIIVSVLLPKTLKPQRSDKLGIKEVGQWIKENSPKPHPAILSDSFRNAYYAGGTHVHMERINGALGIVQAGKVDYILITHREYRVIEKELLQSVEDKKIALAYKFPEENSLNKRSILLYKVLH